MILLAALCGAGYHAATKSLPDFSHPFASLTVSYLTAAACCFVLLPFANRRKNLRFGTSVLQLNWTSLAIGAALVGVETSIYYLYESGSALAVTPLLLSVSQTILTVFVSKLLFHEKIEATNAVGIALCLAGAYLMVV